MTTDTPQKLPEPRIVQGKEMLIAGLRSHFTFESLGGLPALWQRFAPLAGSVPGQIGTTCYGLGYNIDLSGFDYIAGVEVTPGSVLPTDFGSYRVGARRYAVFWHAGHVSAVRGTFMAIYTDWLPHSGHQAADAPVLEHYDERFDPRTGTGGFDVWIPLTA